MRTPRVQEPLEPILKHRLRLVQPIRQSLQHPRIHMLRPPLLNLTDRRPRHPRLERQLRLRQIRSQPRQPNRVIVNRRHHTPPPASQPESTPQTGANPNPAHPPPTAAKTTPTPAPTDSAKTTQGHASQNLHSLRSSTSVAAKLLRMVIFRNLAGRTCFLELAGFRGTTCARATPPPPTPYPLPPES